MTYATPPPGYIALSPSLWGTDVDREDSVIDAGNYAIKFVTNSRYLTSDNFLPARPDQTYRLQSRCRSPSTSWYLQVLVRWYDISHALISSSTITQAINAVDTWEQQSDSCISPSTAVYYRLSFTGVFSSSYFYVSQISFGPGPGHFSVSNKLLTQSIPTAAWTTVEFPSSNLGGSTYGIFDLVNDRFTPTQSTPMLFTWAVGLDNTAVGTYVLTALYNNAVEVARGCRVLNATAGTVDLESVGSRLVGVKPGDNYYIKVIHNEGSALNTLLSATGHIPLFSAHEIGF